MKNLLLPLIVFTILALSLSGQDMFPARQITFDPAQQGFATWSPDGKKIAFTSTRSGSFDIWIMDVNIEKIKRELQKNK